ncbi:unnamed protein product [Chrysodeixis includens]|uniref:Uncharacterized protein n=1 Tax=Chrysodeixis includens TaxID=689277 RepID=A0A9N8Q1I6_CHRIL|nr:unnamed protein product [Chrysodeixis includens]
MVAEMSKLWALVGVVCASIVAINGGNFGVALWTTTAINKCEEPSHKFKFDVTLMVVNETHNGLYGYLELDEDFTKDHGVRIDMYKYHEDEFNMFEVLYDDHMFEFFNKYASKYVKGCFNAAGIDPPAIPLVKIRVEICKHVDGGCKPYQLLSDDCLVNFVNKYAKENVITCLEFAGVDPPEFPIDQGEYQVQDFAFDYCELPTDSIYGTFGAKAFILEGTAEVGCVELHVEFKELDEDEDMCPEKD